MRFTPIFDTGVFINASKGAISASDWRFLRKRLPGHGCPLSAITLGELLMGLHGTEPTMFSDAQKALKFAKSISRGRVLEQPASFLAERVFRATHPAPGLPASQMKMWLDVACKAKTKQDLNQAGVHYKAGLVGLDLSILARDIAKSLALHIRATEKMLDGLQPDWRKIRNTEGASLPEADRNRIRDQVDDELWKKTCALAWLDLLGIQPSAQNVARLCNNIDAALTAVVAFLRETILSNYCFDRNPNDLFDAVQLYYIAEDRFCFVTQDLHLVNRIKKSSQANKVLTFDGFLALLK